MAAPAAAAVGVVGPNGPSQVPAWIPIVALVIALLGTGISWATFASTRDIRTLDKATKRLDLTRTDQDLQAEMVEHVENSYEALSTQVWGAYTETQYLADLRERATIDPTRPIRLEPSAFQLQPRLSKDYRDHENELRSRVTRLEATGSEVRGSLRGVRDDVWPISTLDVVKTVRHVQAACARFTTDPDLRLSEASQIIAAEYALVQDTLRAMRGEATQDSAHK